MKLKQLFTSKKKWTQRAFARDKIGRVTSSREKGACSWCLEGAIYKCYRTKAADILRLTKYHCDGNIVKWNDNPNRKFEDVKKLVNSLDI